MLGCAPVPVINRWESENLSQEKAAYEKLCCQDKWETKMFMWHINSKQIVHGGLGLIQKKNVNLHVGNEGVLKY